MLMCRLCLCLQDQCQSIISVWSEDTYRDLAQRINNCVSVNIQKNEALPEFVCHPCIEKILQWENFKEVCEKSNKILLEKLLLSNEEQQYIEKSHDTNETKTIVLQKESQKITDEELVEHLESLELKTLLTDNIYTCDICYSNFDTCFEYLDHQQSHDDQQAFGCDKCSETFNNRKDLVAHDQNHKISCPYCGKLIQKSGMKLHLIIHSDRFKCDECGGTFNGRGSLATHIAQVHTHIKEHVCDTCGKSFSSQTALTVHMRTHSDERPYNCTECDYSGRTASALYAHKATHASDLLVCQHCPKTFKSGRNLGDHLRRVHATNKKHRCQHCNKTFVDKYMLAVHERWHTGDRRYKCKVCEKAFIRSDGLKEHMVTHEPRTVYICKRCGKKFSTKRSVVRHICNANEIK